MGLGLYNWNTSCRTLGHRLTHTDRGGWNLAQNLITASIQREESKHRVAENSDCRDYPRLRPISNWATAPMSRSLIHHARGFAHTAVPRADTPRLPYSVQRNSRGSIPVYTDIRNAGTRYLVLIRNIQGNVNVRVTLPPFHRTCNWRTLGSHRSSTT